MPSLGKSEEDSYGFRYYDKPIENDEIEIDEDQGNEDGKEFDLESCASECCDSDCECDDCSRCAMNGNNTDGSESFGELPAAA
jgi:hypothetical protein